jgi:hypothetical protein
LAWFAGWAIWADARAQAPRALAADTNKEAFR